MTLSKRSVAWKAAVAATVLAAPLCLAGAAAADTPPQFVVARTLSSGDYVAPLQFARFNGHTYVADSFTSHLWEIGKGAPLVNGPDPSKGGDIAGVAVNTDNGDVAYTTTDFSKHHAQLIVLHKGKPVVEAAIYKFESEHNPDGDVQYGLADPSDQCVADTLSDIGIPASYEGEVDAHPYAVAYLGGGSWAVADAGGNDILKVSSTGVVTLIKTIQKQAFVINQAFASANDLDECAVGKTYYTEAVPTDVEVGPHGLLYASTLPGGPEDPTVPPRGKIYTINPSTRTITQIGGRFVSPTNIAVSRIGTVYVAQPFSGQISVLSQGMPAERMHLPAVTGLEFGADQHLYASTSPALMQSHDDSVVVELKRANPVKH